MTTTTSSISLTYSSRYFSTLTAFLLIMGRNKSDFWTHFTKCTAEPTFNSPEQNLNTAVPLFQTHPRTCAHILAIANTALVLLVDFRTTSGHFSYQLDQLFEVK